jgi:hypothetical protein
MMIIFYILVFLLGLVSGYILNRKLVERAFKIANEKAISDKNDQYRSVLSSLKEGKTSFKTRVNDTVYISTSIVGVGEVDVIFIMDKNDVAIFQGSLCISTSNDVRPEIMADIIYFIYLFHSKSINDIVDVWGFKFYRPEFEKLSNTKVDEINKMNQNISEIDKIKGENSIRFDIDEILDKINQSGITSLTFEERLFLDNYSNEKRG